MEAMFRSTALLFLISESLSAIDPDPTRCKSVIGTLKSNYGNANISINRPKAYITCINDSTLRGSQNVTCQLNGSWDPPFPKCLVNCPALPDRPVVFTKETITYVQTDTKDRYAGKSISLYCANSDYVIDGPSTITCKSNRKWMPDIPKCKPRPEPPDRLWVTILAITGPIGLALVVTILIAGKFLLRRREQKHDKKEAIQLSEMSNSKTFYKVWTVSRKHKKLISAVDLKSLKAKASNIFDMGDGRHARLVLEEDGTEVNNNSAMILSHDKTFMILDKDKVWKPVSLTDEETLKLTYDVCSFGRSKRKLFLAGTKEELLNQAKQASFSGWGNWSTQREPPTMATTSFKYETKYLCLEADGTIIDDDNSLDAVAGQQIMSLRNPNDWSLMSSNERIPQLNIENKSGIDQRNCFKVWTEDQHYKKIVFADDLVELHIKAAKALSLMPPIELSVLDDDVAITDNDQLRHHKRHILIAKESRDMDNSVTPSVYSGEYTNLPDIVY